MKDSAKPKTSNQSWYENYLYACLEALTSSDLKLQTAAATTLTSGGQTPHPISTIFYRLPQGTIANMLTENKDPASKTVG